MSGGADLKQWLNARVARAPAALRARMSEALEETGSFTGPPAQRLLEAAAACIRRAIALGPHRDAALELLAADGLLTAACDAAAEAGDAGPFARHAGERLALLLNTSDPP